LIEIKGDSVDRDGSACHRFHTAHQRLARWLLMASDRTRSSRVELTQEQLAHVLGLQRTGVTVANVALQDAGAIRSRHGRITIVDRKRLENLACECYGTPG
jgi:CRP-like cAMP-binding protein